MDSQRLNQKKTEENQQATLLFITHQRLTTFFFFFFIFIKTKITLTHSNKKKNLKTGTKNKHSKDRTEQHITAQTSARHTVISPEV